MTTTLTNDDIQAEALSRAATGQSLANVPAIIAGFTAKGIPEAEIKPRENVFTYHAWQALGRQVRRGEHGVRITTFVSFKGKGDTANPDATGKRRTSRPWFTTVFHVSQTDPIR
jgi:antirestriction protein ArdC